MTKKYKVSPKKSSLTVQKPSDYEQDFYRWVNSQAKFIKNKDFDRIDCKNLVEELLSLGRNERQKLESYLTVFLAHLLKIKYQPAYHTSSWDISLKKSHIHFSRILKENPSLKPKLDDVLKNAYADARLEAASETALKEKTFPAESPWTKEFILKWKPAKE